MYLCNLYYINHCNFKDAEKTLDLNVKAVVVLTRLLVPGMIERGFGHIINISSVAAETIASGIYKKMFQR